MERLPDVRQENTLRNGRVGIPTFAEVLDLRRRLYRELWRDLGIYPETKHPTFFRAVGLPLEQRLPPGRPDGSPVHLRAENTFLPKAFQVGTAPAAYGRAIDEQVTFLLAGIDGVFTDQPDIGVAARTTFLTDRAAAAA